MLKRVLTICCVIVFASLLAACGSKENTKSITSTNNFKSVCTKGEHFSRAASYSSNGPHPIVIFQPGTTDAGEQVTVPAGLITTRLAPGNFEKFKQAWLITSDTVKNTQLISCPKRIKSTATGQKCTFNDKSTADTYRSEYELTVYEAKTGNKRGKTTLTAQTPTCPYLAVFKGSDRKIYSQPTSEEYIQALEKFVNSGIQLRQ